VADLIFTQGDTAPSVFGALTNADGTPFDLTDATVRFQMREAIDRRFSVDSAAVIVDDPTAGNVRYDWAEGDLATAGDFVSHWRILFTDTSIEHTIPANTITVQPQ
jgi:hypothetical protein